MMACLSKERNDSYRIHWKFKAKLGPRAGETFEGSLHLGRCTKTAAKSKQREIEEWEDRVKTGRFVPDRNAEEVFKLWLRERDLTCTPQTLGRSEQEFVYEVGQTARFILWCNAEKNKLFDGAVVPFESHDSLAGNLRKKLFLHGPVISVQRSTES